MKVAASRREGRVLAFDCVAGSFFLEKIYFCENPECRSAHVALVECDPSGAVRASGKSWIGFSIQCDAWIAGSCRSSGRHGKAADRVAQDYVQSLTDELRAALCRRADAFRADYRLDPDFDLTDEEIASGVMVSLDDITGRRKEGRVSGFRLEHGGRTYAVEDGHCINPDCRCRDFILCFYETAGTRDGEQTSAREAFTAECTLKRGFRAAVRGAVSIPPAEAAGALEAWRKKMPGFKDELERHRARVKEVGVMLLERHGQRRKAAGGKGAAPSPGIPRNAPCPCGSGKKYKRCCGRRRPGH